MKKIKNKRLIKQIMIVMILLLSFFALPNDVVLADSTPDYVYSPLNKTGKADFKLDSIPYSALEDDESFLEKITSGAKGLISKIPGLGWLDEMPSFQDITPIMVNFFLDMAFQLNVAMTEALIFFLDLALNLEFVEPLLNKIERSITSVAGVKSDGTIRTTSFFGTFAGIVGIATIVYAIFIFFFRRSVMGSMFAILQTVGIIALSILIFMKFPTYMGGLNKIGMEASNLLLGGTATPHNVSYDGDIEIIDGTGGTGQAPLIERVKDNIRITFVDRPYLIMMFGDWDYERLGDGNAEVGRKRVEKIVYANSAEDKYEALIEEGLNGNEKVMHGNVDDRFALTPIYFLTNTFTSFVLITLSSISIFLQFWFLLIAIVAPFVLLISALPGQIGVLWQYLKELLSPIFFKIGLSFFILMFFIFTESFYELVTDNTFFKVNAVSFGWLVFSGLTGGIGPVLLFIALFILVRRIYKIFSSGSSIFGKTSEKLIGGASKVTGTAGVVAGAVAGGIMTGGAGATAGAKIGGALQGATIGGGIGGQIPGSLMGDETSQKKLAGATVGSLFMAKNMQQQRERNASKAQQLARQKQQNLINDRKALTEDLNFDGVNKVEEFLKTANINDESINQVFSDMKSLDVNFDDMDMDLLESVFEEHFADGRTELDAGAFSKELKVAQYNRRTNEGKEQFRMFLEEIERTRGTKLSDVEKQGYEDFLFTTLEVDPYHLNTKMFNNTLNKMKKNKAPINQYTFGKALERNVNEQIGRDSFNTFVQGRGYSPERIKRMTESLSKESVDFTDINDEIFDELPSELDYDNFGKTLQEIIEQRKWQDVL